MRPADRGQLTMDVLVAHADQLGQMLDAVTVKRKPIGARLRRGRVVRSLNAAP